jgi:hypothetical protein
MTRQIYRMGLRPLVVGKDGEGYERERWRESLTFRSGDQRNLLVEDNRSREFAAAPDWLRARIESETWCGAQ